MIPAELYKAYLEALIKRGALPFRIRKQLNRVNGTLLTPAQRELVQAWHTLTEKQWTKLPRYDLLQDHLNMKGNETVNMVVSIIRQGMGQATLRDLHYTAIQTFLSEYLHKDYLEKINGIPDKRERLINLMSMLLRIVDEKLPHSLIQTNTGRKLVLFHDPDKYNLAKSKEGRTSAKATGSNGDEIRDAQDFDTGQFVTVKVVKIETPEDLIAAQAEEVAVAATGRNKADLTDPTSPALGTVERERNDFDKLYIVMHNAEGDNLAKLLRRDKLSPEQLGRLGERRLTFAERINVAKVVAKDIATNFHAKGWLHRDLSAPNVMVLLPPANQAEFSLTAEVVDLEFSALLAAIRSRQELMGTGRYIAPEICRIYIQNNGRIIYEDNEAGATYSKAIDVYALGVLMLELMGPHIQYTRSDNQMIPNIAIRAEAYRILSVNEIVQLESYLNLARSALSIAPENRPTMQQFWDSIEAIEKLNVEVSRTVPLDPMVFNFAEAALKFNFFNRDHGPSATESKSFIPPIPTQPLPELPKVSVEWEDDFEYSVEQTFEKIVGDAYNCLKECLNSEKGSFNDAQLKSAMNFYKRISKLKMEYEQDKTILKSDHRISKKFEELSKEMALLGRDNSGGFFARFKKNLERGSFQFMMQTLAVNLDDLARAIRIKDVSTMTIHNRRAPSGSRSS